MGRVPRFETTSAAEYGLFVLDQRESCTSTTSATCGEHTRMYAHLPPLLDLCDLSLECLAFARHRRRVTEYGENDRAWWWGERKERGCAGGCGGSERDSILI